MTSHRIRTVAVAGAGVLVAGLVLASGPASSDDMEKGSRLDPHPGVSAAMAALLADGEDTGPESETEGPPVAADDAPRHPPTSQPPPADAGEARERARELARDVAPVWDVVGCGTTTAGELTEAQTATGAPVAGGIADAPSSLRLHVCAVDLGSHGVAAAVFPAERAPHRISTVWQAAEWEALDHLPALPRP